VLYRTVPLDHPDTTALQLLAGLLNGRSGRLYRSLVVERQLAFAAFAQQTPYARAGVFEVVLEAKGGHDPAELVAAWDAELASLLAAPIAAEELERAKNVLAAEALRQLREPSQLMRRLLIYDALGGWRLLTDWPERLRQVSESEVRDVAARYLEAELRLVAVFRRQGASR
jgi:predicted Zn-dependent peptidase